MSLKYHIHLKRSLRGLKTEKLPKNGKRRKNQTKQIMAEQTEVKIRGNADPQQMNAVNTGISKSIRRDILLG